MPGLRQGRHPVDPGRHPALLREMWVRGLDVDADRMTTPIARTTDPWTSHAGAVEVTDSGRRRTQMELCLDVVQAHPGRTAGEVGELTGLGHVRAQRRLSDLKAAGKIVTGAAVRSLNVPVYLRQRPQVTWWPTDRQGTLL
jgi:hypothetical protein